MKLNRAQRRAAKRKGKKHGLQDAGNQLQKALTALEGAESLADLDGVARTLKVIKGQVGDTAKVLIASGGTAPRSGQLLAVSRQIEGLASVHRERTCSMFERLVSS